MLLLNLGTPSQQTFTTWQGAMRQKIRSFSIGMEACHQVRFPLSVLLLDSIFKLQRRRCMQQDHHPQQGVSFRSPWCHHSAQWPTESKSTLKTRSTWGTQRPTPSISCSRLTGNPMSEFSLEQFVCTAATAAARCTRHAHTATCRTAASLNGLPAQHVPALSTPLRSAFHPCTAFLSATCCAGLLRRAPAQGS